VRNCLWHFRCSRRRVRRWQLPRIWRREIGTTRTYFQCHDVHVSFRENSANYYSNNCSNLYLHTQLQTIVWYYERRNEIKHTAKNRVRWKNLVEALCSEMEWLEQRKEMLSVVCLIGVASNCTSTAASVTATDHEMKHGQENCRNSDIWTEIFLRPSHTEILTFRMQITAGHTYHLRYTTLSAASGSRYLVWYGVTCHTEQHSVRNYATCNAPVASIDIYQQRKIHDNRFSPLAFNVKLWYSGVVPRLILRGV
jgi:hypothetical protein